MVQLKNISEHRPKGLIIDVAEKDAKELIKTGEFVELTKENLIIEKKKEIIKEDEEKIEDIKNEIKKSK